MANSNGWGDGAANNAIGWGQGANNNIGWGNSHATSWAGATDIVGLDSSASAFISAAGITDATQISAINNLVVGMKADGLWSKMKAIYPFVTDNVNLFGYTTTFTSPNYVTDSTATFTLNNTTAPDGSNTGVRFTAVGSNNNYFYSANTQGGNNFGTGNKAFSIYVKAGTFSGSMSLGITSDGSTTRTNFSLTNDWQRITITRNVIVAGNSAQYYIDLSGNSMTSGQYFYIWAPQFENGTTATTYQPIATTQQAYIASQFKYNLKDPRDLDAAFRLVFNGGWTHSSTGATPNGTNGYADTKLNQSTNLSNDSVHLCYYSRTNSSVNSFDIGGNSGLPNYYGAQIASYYTSIGTIGHLNSYPTDSTVSTAFSDTRAFYLASRISATSNKLFRNASLLNTNTTTRTSTLANVNFRLASDAVGFTNREAAFASIGNGLTDTEASNLYTRVQQFNTTLLRQV